jgi:hypothetical protein
MGRALRATSRRINAPSSRAAGDEAAGFEQAEEELVEVASHGDPAPDPTELADDPRMTAPTQTTGSPTESSRSSAPRRARRSEDDRENDR